MSDLIAIINVKPIEVNSFDIFSSDEELDLFLNSPIESQRAFLSNLYYDGAFDTAITIDIYE